MGRLEQLIEGYVADTLVASDREHFERLLQELPSLRARIESRRLALAQTTPPPPPERKAS